MKHWITVPRFLIQSYAIVALACAALVLFLASQKGIEFFAISVALFAIAALAGWLIPRTGILFAIALATLSGWMQSSFSGYSVHVSIGVLCVAVGMVILRLKWEKHVRLHIVHLLILFLAVMAVVSAIFTILRVTSFVPAPGFEYQNYAVNPLGFPSDDLIYQVINRTANIIIWFGLLLCASRFPYSKRGVVFTVVAVIVVLNVSVVSMQVFNDSDFLAPAGSEVDKVRASGLASFEYALGAVSEVLFIFAPVWFLGKGRQVYVSLIVIALLLFIAFMSGSRTALFVICGSAILWLMHFLNAKLKKLRAGVRLAALIAVVLIIISISVSIYSVTPANEGSSLGRLKKHVNIDGGIFEHLARTRLAQYVVYFDMISRYPVSGIGVGSHYAVASAYAPIHLPDFKAKDRYAMKSNVSNTYLGFGVEMGLLAMVAFTTVVIWLVFMSSKSDNTDHQRQHNLLRLSVFVYAFGLLLGPQLYNPEAVGWFWLLAGALVQSPKSISVDPTGTSRRTGLIFGAGIAVISILYILMQTTPLKGLNPSELWKKLRWNIDMGWYLREDKGRWSKPEAATTLSPGALVLLKWHAGATGIEHLAKVKFYIDGQKLFETSAAKGEQQESVLVIPTEVEKSHLLALSVDPPMIPKQFGQGDDSRNLGIFVNYVRVRERLNWWVGFFEEEREKTGRKFRWAGSHAWIPLRKRDKYLLNMRGVPLDPASKPLKLKLSFNNVELKTVTLSKSWQPITFSFDELSAITKSGLDRQLILHLEVQNPESISRSKSRDSRDIYFAIATVR